MFASINFTSRWDSSERHKRLYAMPYIICLRHLESAVLNTRQAEQRRGCKSIGFISFSSLLHGARMYKSRQMRQWMSSSQLGESSRRAHGTNVPGSSTVS